MQLIVGIMLLAGTVVLARTAYPVVRQGSGEVSKALSSAAGTIESLRNAYEKSAEGVFGLTNTIDDVERTLRSVSDSVGRTGSAFCQYSEAEGFSRNLRPFKETARDCGEKMTAAGRDISSVADALQAQSVAIREYSVNGHESFLSVMSQIVDILRGTVHVLDSAYSAALWCGFVCILGLCVSLLLIMNGILLFAFAPVWRRGRQNEWFEPPVIPTQAVGILV